MGRKIQKLVKFNMNTNSEHISRETDVFFYTNFSMYAHESRSFIGSTL